MDIIHEFAPAKLNLYLHITGRRADGYHNLDSLVAFATIGDRISLQTAQEFSLKIEGRNAEALAQENHADNLVVKAAKTLAELMKKTLNVELTLLKNLPIASGIGGGSSDAAATLRALAHHWGLEEEDPRLIEAAAQHGQDVPVCLKIENNYVTAKGVVTAPKLPRVNVVLVNPGKGLSTPSVYKEYKKEGDAFSPVARLEQAPTTVDELVTALMQRHNDLYAAACRLMPEISMIISALEKTPHCLLARMSGSGATCFGLYKDVASAQAAVSQIQAQHPSWWVEAGAINA